MSSRLPWYPWWLDDHARVTRGWPPLARLAYRELLDQQWAVGTLPEDAEALRVLVPGISVTRWQSIWPFIDKAFPIAGDGRVNPELEALRDKQTAKSDKARKSAEARWRADRGDVIPIRDGRER